MTVNEVGDRFVIAVLDHKNKVHLARPVYASSLKMVKDGMADLRTKAEDCITLLSKYFDNGQMQIRVMDGDAFDKKYSIYDRLMAAMLEIDVFDQFVKGVQDVLSKKT